MPQPIPLWQKLGKTWAMPVALAALCALVVLRAFVSARPAPWALLGLAVAFSLGRFALGQGNSRERLEDALLCGVLAVAAGQLAKPLQPLVYLIAAGYTLLFPLPLAIPLCCVLVGLDAAVLQLPRQWPVLLAHASFAALFASLYHALLGARLAASRRAEAAAVRRRVAEAEERARELRLVATAVSSPEREALSLVTEVEDVLRGALAVAEAALKPHTVAVFLLSADGESVRLRECLSQSEKLVREPIGSREGALGAVLSAALPVRMANAREQIGYYQGRAEASAFLGVPLLERSGALLGALAADREEPFTENEQEILEALSRELVRAIEAERLLGSVRREKEGKARFFEALEALNRTTTVAEAARTAVSQARRMCPSVDLCVLTVAEGRRHRVLAAGGDGAAALGELDFADNAGLVSNVVKLGSALPGREISAMDRLIVFDNSTVLKGLGALKIFPLRAGDACIGALVCGSRDRDGLPQGAQSELSHLALQAAEAVTRARLYEEAEKLATTDGLTGLSNRRAFNGLLEQRLREAARYERPLSLLLLDIDHFKKVNDTHGHPAGDAVLRGVARLAQKAARETDVAARYGGEELALILPETDARGALAIAERLRKLVEAASHPTEQGSVKVTVSIGVSTTSGKAALADLLEAADRALYKAKRSGRNRVEASLEQAAA
ncbi:MAG TPA: sensor domain-containing diguanylate cyclase [Myxococcales bacterium]